MAATNAASGRQHASQSDPQGQDASETTPLLTADIASTSSITAIGDGPIEAGNHLEDASPAGDPEPALPRSQLFFLCYIRLIEPVAYFGIFPFINAMVQRNGNLPAAEVGFYSGLIESLFSLTQMIVMVFWGKAADRFGRKPVLVFSVAGVSVATAAFGLATTIWQMILLRCLAGVFAGTISTIRTMFGELSTPRTQARAYSYFAFSGNVGIFLGPLIGGALADPATQYGGIWKRATFLVDHPYALPPMATGVFGVSATLVAAFFVKETINLEKKPARPDQSNGDTNGSALQSSEPPKPLTIPVLVRSPGVPTVLFLYGALSMLAFAYTALMPVYQFTPRSLGGWGFTSVQISIVLAVTGAAQALWILLAYPPLQKRYGTRNMLRACGIGWCVFLTVPSLLGLLLWSGSKQAEIAFWVIMPPLLCVGVGISMSYTAIQLALNAVTPGDENMSVLNSLALAMSSGVRAFAPFSFSSLFAVGVERQILGGQLAWLVIWILAVAWAVGTWWLPDKTDDRIPKRK